MPPAAEPKGWLVLDRVRTDLSTMVADADHWYGPTAVFVVRTWEDARMWDSSVGAPGDPEPRIVMGVRRIERNHQRDTTGDVPNGSGVRAVMDVAVLVNVLLRPSSETDPAVNEAQILERSMRDVIRRLAFEDPGLGVAVVAEDVEGQTEGGADDAILEDPEPGWVSAVLSFKVAYEYMADEP